MRLYCRLTVIQTALQLKHQKFAYTNSLHFSLYPFNCRAMISPRPTATSSPWKGQGQHHAALVDMQKGQAAGFVFQQGRHIVLRKLLDINDIEDNLGAFKCHYLHAYRRSDAGSTVIHWPNALKASRP